MMIFYYIQLFIKMIIDAKQKFWGKIPFILRMYANSKLDLLDSKILDYLESLTIEDLIFAYVDLLSLIKTTIDGELEYLKDDKYFNAYNKKILNGYGVIDYTVEYDKKDNKPAHITLSLKNYSYENSGIIIQVIIHNKKYFPIMNTKYIVTVKSNNSEITEIYNNDNIPGNYIKAIRSSIYGYIIEYYTRIYLNTYYNNRE